MVDFILRLFDRLGWLLTRLGVDRQAFRAILEVKLLQDQRRTIAGIQDQNAKKKPQRALMMSMIIYAFVGTLIGLIIFWIQSPLVGLTFVNSFIMMMMGFLMVADFTTVLMDTTDNTVILPRPVSGRTLLAVRTAHIVIYLGLLALSLSAGTLVMGAFAYHPLFPLVFVATLALSLLLVVFVVFVFYMLAMRIVDIERFRDIILYFQIFMSVCSFGIFQVVLRIIDLKEAKTLSIDDAWWIYLFPPAWMAGPVELLVGNRGLPQFILTGLACFVPVVCLLFVVRVLAPGFTRILGGMGSSAAAQEGRQSRGEKLGAIARLCATLFTRKGEERAAFQVVWATVARDRAFKLATYPSLAMVVLLTGLMVFGDLKDGTLSALGDSRVYLLNLYLVCAVAPAAFGQMRFSEFHDAAWVFYALPVRRPGPILSGAFKVALARFALPLYLAFAIFVVAVWGPTALWDIALVGLILPGFLLLSAYSLGHAFPFSKARTGQQSHRGAFLLVLLILLAGVGWAHYGLTHVAYGVPAAVVIVFVLVVYGLHRYRSISWFMLETD